MRRDDYLDHFGNSDFKRSEVFTKLSVYCKNCGHTLLVVNKDRLICSHCGHWVYKDDKTEFMYKLKEGMNKNGTKKDV